MKPSKCPAREKKMRQERRKKKEEKKRKVKVNTAVSLLNPKTAHARTSQADVLHPDQMQTGLW